MLWARFRCHSRSRDPITWCRRPIWFLSVAPRGQEHFWLPKPCWSLGWYRWSNPIGIFCDDDESKSQTQVTVHCCAWAADSQKQWLDAAALELVTFNWSLFWRALQLWLFHVGPSSSLLISLLCSYDWVTGTELAHWPRIAMADGSVVMLGCIATRNWKLSSVWKRCWFHHRSSSSSSSLNLLQ